MRVLLIDVNCKNSSTGNIVYDLYKYVNAQPNCEAAVCYGRGPKIREKNIYKFGLKFETALHGLLTRITGYTGRFSYFSTKRLIKFIRNFKPDVVHIHELHAYFVNISMLLNFLKKQKIKVVHTLHCAFSYTGKCGHHYDCNQWKNGCENCPKLKDYISTWFFDKTSKMYKEKEKAFSGFEDLTIVCPSNWMAGNARQSFLGKYPIKVIYNGLDSNVVHPYECDDLREKYNIASTDKVVLAVAPNLMSELKGGKYIVKMANDLKNSNIKFIMIGVKNGSEKFEGNLLQLKPIFNKILLYKFYSLADLFVICSKMETLPTTCIEAQLCGTPVCGFDVGGVKETIFNENGHLFDYGEFSEMKRFILRSENKNKQEYSFQGKYFDRINFLKDNFDLY